jgi:hypothetical protein
MNLEFKHLKNVLTDYAMALQSRYKDNLLKSDRVASGDLIKSIHYQLDFQDTVFTISLNIEDYWKYIEYGTRPHFPPVNKILEWIKIKPVLPYPNKNGKLPTPNQLAYLIGRKISEVGTKGSQDLEDTLENLNKDYEQLISEALAKDIDESIDYIFTFLYKP